MASPSKPARVLVQKRLLNLGWGSNCTEKKQDRSMTAIQFFERLGLGRGEKEFINVMYPSVKDT